jgi:hypothetical protein
LASATSLFLSGLPQIHRKRFRTAETYGASLTAGDLSGSTLNYADLAILSVAFNADGSMFGARACIGFSQ